MYFGYVVKLVVVVVVVFLVFYCCVGCDDVDVVGIFF